MSDTLGFALLGLLARRPLTGYELTHLLRAPIVYYWSASHSQVYPSLSRLEAEKLVSHRVINGPGPRDTKRYRITSAGRRALTVWTVTLPGAPVNRDELMLKVYSLWTADPQRARAMVAAQREADEATLRHYEEMERAMHREHPAALANPATPEFSSYATLRRGLSYQAHAIAWCDWLLSEL